MKLIPKTTRFRAYKLNSTGSSFSYFDGSNFTLIEARYENNKNSIVEELAVCKHNIINTLHITSWDTDHCNPNELKELMDTYQINKIEYPGYEPHTDSGHNSLKLILDYKKYQNIKRKTSNVKAIKIDPDYIEALDNCASTEFYTNILYHPREIIENSSNDNSTIKFFRTGSFNVLSLGDVESPLLSAYLRRQKILKHEVDVLILAHHGADNGFTSSNFLKNINPKFAIASSDYANQYDHPRQEIRDLLYEHDIKLFTTKTGDVVIKSINSHIADYQVTNYKSDNTGISSQYTERSKKFVLLRQNEDSIKNYVNGKKNYLKI
ncbi:MAG: hypothetical protein K2Q03_10685 [Sphingobacteriaceae bacterium]|nr:hypothetical protein [Sphingobacteriaceae bacterium]